MRLVLVALLAGGCLGGTLDSNLRPAVTPKLSELPADPGRRDAVLDSSHVTSGPEQGSPDPGKQLTKKERRAVGAAATAAAVLGWVFSDTENVTLGGGTTIDENELFVPSRPAATAEDDDAPAPPPEDLPPAETLVPWVKLKK